MAENIEPKSPYDWAELLTNTAGFVLGFLLGGATGYFGNWLWDKFKPRKKDGHLLVETDKEGTSFSGRITNADDNKEQVLKTLRATATPTGNSQTYSRSNTGSISTSKPKSTKRI